MILRYTNILVFINLLIIPRYQSSGDSYDEAIRLEGESESDWINLFQGFEEAATLITDDDGEATVPINYNQGATIGQTFVKNLYVSMNGLISFKEPFNFPNPINNIAKAQYGLMSAEINKTLPKVLRNSNIPSFAALVAPFWADLVTLSPGQTETTPKDTNFDNSMNSGVYFRCFNNPQLISHLPVIAPKLTTKTEIYNQSDINLLVDGDADKKVKRDVNNPSPTLNISLNQTDQDNHITPLISVPLNISSNSTETLEQNVLNNNYFTIESSIPTTENPKLSLIKTKAPKYTTLNNTNISNNLTNNVDTLNTPIVSSATLISPLPTKKTPKNIEGVEGNKCSTNIPLNIRSTIAKLINSRLQDFEPLFMMIATWSNLTTFATRETMKNTHPALLNFQSVLIIDDEFIHIIFHYKYGAMLNLWNQFISDVKIGYSLFGSKEATYFMPNISLIQDAEGIDKKIGNIGLPGIYYYKIKIPSNFGVKCYETFNKFRNHNISLGVKGYNDCPCTLGMAKLDMRFKVEENCATLVSSIAIKGFRYWPVCCYDDEKETLIPTYPSRFHYDKMLEKDKATSQLWNECCAEQNSSNLCQFYYQIQGYVSCQSYQSMDFASISDSFYMIPIAAPSGYFYNAQGMYRIFDSDLCRVQGIWFYRHMSFQNITYRYPSLKHVAFGILENVVDIMYNEGSMKNNVYVDGKTVNLPYREGLFSIYVDDGQNIILSNYLFVAKITMYDGSFQLHYYASPNCFTNLNPKTSLLTLYYDNSTGLFTPPQIPTLKMNASTDFENFNQFGNSCKVSRADSIFKQLVQEEEQLFVSEKDVRNELDMNLITKNEPLIRNLSYKYRTELDAIKAQDNMLYYQCLAAFLIHNSNNQQNSLLNNFDYLATTQKLARHIFSMPQVITINGPSYIQAVPGVMTIYNFTFNQPDHNNIRVQTYNTNGKLAIHSNGTFTYQPLDFAPAYIRIYVYNKQDATILSVYQPNVLLSQCQDINRNSPFSSNNENWLKEIPQFLKEAPLGLYRPVQCQCSKWRFGPHCAYDYCDYKPCYKGAPCEGYSNQTSSPDEQRKCPPCPSYAKGDGLKCEDIDECSKEPPVCDLSVSTCNNTYPFYTCKCNAGFEPGDRDLKCQAINSCDRAENACPQGFICVSQYGNGTKECICPKGTQLLDNVCLGINECLTPNLCGDHAECIDLDVGYECACHHGYYKSSNNSLCYDINECDRLQSIFRNNCSQDCYNQPGSYQCACFDAFVPKIDSRPELGICQPKVLCSNPNSCNEQAFCAKVLNEDKCYCPPGFILTSSGVCSDIDECKLPENLCRRDSNAYCANTAGSYYCTCTKGYKWSDTNFTCIDINECLYGPEFTKCYDPAYCINEPGTFMCECPPTLYYEADNGTCSVKSSCGGERCGFNSHCEAQWTSIYDPESGTYVNGAEEVCTCNKAFYASSNLTAKAPNCTKVPIAMQLKMDLLKNYQSANLQEPYNKNWSLLAKEIHRPICHALSFLFGDLMISCQVENFTQGKPINATDSNISRINASLILGFVEKVADSGLLAPDNLNFIPDVLSNSFGWPHSNSDRYKRDTKEPNYYLPTTAIKVDPNSLRIEDLNECDTDINKCPLGISDCINTFGSYKCVCKNGFRNVPHWIHPDVSVCQDIDECQENLNNCSSWGALCINTPGGYICQCPAGYGTLYPGETKCIAYGRDRYWKNFAILISVILGLLLLLSLILLIIICAMHPSIKDNIIAKNPPTRLRYGMDRNETESFSTKIPRPKLTNIPFTEDDDISNSQVCIRSPHLRENRYAYDNPIAYQGSSIITHF